MPKKLSPSILKKHGVFGAYDKLRKCFWEFIFTPDNEYWDLKPDYDDNIQQAMKKAKCNEYVLLKGQRNLLKNNDMFFVVDKRKEHNFKL